MRFLALFCCLFLFLSTTPRKDAPLLIAKAYSLGPASVLTVNGTTNVNEFCCLSTEELGLDTMFYTVDEATGSVNFLRTGINLTVDELDCGNKMINRDLRKTLQSAEYPFISIELLNATNPQCPDLTDCKDWTQFSVTVNLTIGCNTRTEIIDVQLKNNGANRLRLFGDISVQLSDFEIEAPVAMLGIIKVRDEIQVGFDLEVQLL